LGGFAFSPHIDSEPGTRMPFGKPVLISLRIVDVCDEFQPSKPVRPRNTLKTRKKPGFVSSVYFVGKNRSFRLAEPLVAA
jgi:hypothetical protein